ncbi:MAG: bifunctional aspartate kinase/homoserine dehydrogenase I, partial [Muribaculaceae bacterium]|nr:bifunctional aspartate kinase/homoserine dehydrogenase I [Muribaculaceae bacterium]
LIAAALDASLLEIWTDVDGFMSADPRIIPDARVMPAMSFIESMELCSFGAKVIYPPTIYPVFHKNIPIKILNTFNPTAPGTLITDRHEDKYPESNGVSSATGIKGVSSIKGITLFNIAVHEMRATRQLRSRALNVLAKRGITVLQATREENEPVLSFAVSSADSETVTTLLSSEFAPELSKAVVKSITGKSGLAVVAVVGEGMKERNRLAPRILNSLNRDSINVESYSHRSSATTLSFVIDEESVPRALRIIHSLLF